MTNFHIYNWRDGLDFVTRAVFKGEKQGYIPKFKSSQSINPYTRTRVLTWEELGGNKFKHKASLSSHIKHKQRI